MSGAALWLRREALDRVGGWDERFFLFFEDVDLCRRLGADGWTITYEPSGRVMHTVGGSRARRPVRSIVEHHRAAYQYADKWWHGPRRLLPARSPRGSSPPARDRWSRAARRSGRAPERHGASE